MLAGREQADADRLLKEVEGLAADGEVIVALTHLDIGHPIFTHFFGRARHHGSGALVSTARLMPEFYGMPEDHETTRLRATLEIVHELGHVAGLPHCDDNGCLMHFAPTVEAIDNRGQEFCRACAAAVEHELHPHLSRR
jgi:archaemetzincin